MYTCVWKNLFKKRKINGPNGKPLVFDCPYIRLKLDLEGPKSGELALKIWNLIIEANDSEAKSVNSGN